VPLGGVTPMMSTQNLARFQGYLKGLGGVQADSAKLVPLLASGALHVARRDFGGLLGAMQANAGIFSQVPAGLATTSRS
jgi:hypothetical protein